MVQSVEDINKEYFIKIDYLSQTIRLTFRSFMTSTTIHKMNFNAEVVPQ